MYCLSPPMTEPPEGKSTLHSVSVFLNARSFFSLSKVVSIPKFLVSLIWWNLITVLKSLMEIPQISTIALILG